MHLKKRGVAAAALLLAAGCSGDVGQGNDGWGEGPNASADNQTGGSQGSNDKGLKPGDVITTADGKTVTVGENGELIDQDGNVIPEDEAEDILGEVSPQKPDDSSSTDAPAVEGDPIIPDVQKATCTPGTPKISSVPRLTNTQYDNTVAALLGKDLGLSASVLAQESKGNMDRATLTGFQNAAASIAQTVFSDAAVRAKVITCATEDAVCATEVITNFGAKVFRRPLEAAEIEAYTSVFANTALTETGSFDDQLKVVIEAMFQSPNFLTIAETSGAPVADPAGGQRLALSGHEVAARLSYMLWNSTPDDALTAAAADGSLLTDAGIAAQAARLLDDPRAFALVDSMHKAYMRMGDNTKWVNYTRDAAKYPAYKPAQLDLLAQETLEFAKHVFASGGSFKQLMTDTTGFVNADTAALYGLNASDFGAELEPTDLGAGRPGIFTRAGFLAANSYESRTSPIHRGAHIQKMVLCNVLGAAAPNVAGTPLPQREGLVTNRQMTDAQTEAIEGGCRACHQSIINPTGFALEGFDAVGGVQTMDNGVAVDSKAQVPIDGSMVAVNGAADLANAIAGSAGAHACYARKWVEIGYARVPSEQDACTADTIAAKMADANYSVKQLVTDLTTIETFRYRAFEN